VKYILIGLTILIAGCGGGGDVTVRPERCTDCNTYTNPLTGELSVECSNYVTELPFSCGGLPVTRTYEPEIGEDNGRQENEESFLLN
jgi:hypothetical protein